MFVACCIVISSGWLRVSRRTSDFFFLPARWLECLRAVDELVCQTGAGRFWRHFTDLPQRWKWAQWILEPDFDTWKKIISAEKHQNHRDARLKWLTGPFTFFFVRGFDHLHRGLEWNPLAGRKRELVEVLKEKNDILLGILDFANSKMSQSSSCPIGKGWKRVEHLRKTTSRSHFRNLFPKGSLEAS